MNVALRCFLWVKCITATYIHTLVLFENAILILNRILSPKKRERLLERVHVYKLMPGIFIFPSYLYSSHSHHAKYIRLHSPNHPTILPGFARPNETKSIFRQPHMNRLHTLRYISVSTICVYLPVLILLCSVKDEETEISNALQIPLTREGK